MGDNTYFVSKRPQNIGILAIEVYFPKTFVSQRELESYYNVSEGKYTLGLGQNNMGFCTDLEDVNSICLTVTKSLMEKYNIDYNDVGRVEVGTETLIDKSKSVKSVLMELFKSSGNFWIEGVDNKNACYGGTAALFNSIDWIESSAWDGRYAIVVAGDIAVYEYGPARPTGGAGAIAMLIGPDAPLVIESQLRSTYMENVHDFYKPVLNSDYPIVNGNLSVNSYFKALVNCYLRFIDKSKVYKKEVSGRKLDFLVFHTPFSKLVAKAFCRLVLLDAIHQGQFIKTANMENQPFLRNIEQNQLKRKLDDDTERRLQAILLEDFNVKTKPSLLISKEVGNMYCGSLYAGLASLAYSIPDLCNKRIGMFSYGSGLASSFFTVRCSGFLDKIRENLNLDERIRGRTEVKPSQFEDIMKLREHPMELAPKSELKLLGRNTFYIDSVDRELVRLYKYHE